MGKKLFDFSAESQAIQSDVQTEDQKIQSKAVKTKERHDFRRLIGEKALENLLDWNFEEDVAYHVLSGGDIDSISFLKFILRQQTLSYCLLSTWCMAKADIEELGRFLLLKRILRLDCYVGEIFKGSYKDEWIQLCDLIRKHKGRVAMFRNHSKIYVGFGEKFNFVVESSANINTNPRTENTVITVNSYLAHAYKQFFDGIKSFERNFDDWESFQL